MHMDHKMLGLLYTLAVKLEPKKHESSFDFVTRCEKAKLVSFSDAYAIRKSMSVYWKPAVVGADTWITSDQLTLDRMLSPEYMACVRNEATNLTENLYPQ